MIVQDYLPRTMYKGKTVFITGGGSGINLGVARNFAVLGAHLASRGRYAVQRRVQNSRLGPHNGLRSGKLCDRRALRVEIRIRALFLAIRFVD